MSTLYFCDNASTKYLAQNLEGPRCSLLFFAVRFFTNIYALLKFLMRRQGVETGFSAWKAPMLTVTPSSTRAKELTKSFFIRSLWLKLIQFFRQQQ